MGIIFGHALINHALTSLKELVVEILNLFVLITVLLGCLLKKHVDLILLLLNSGGTVLFELLVLLLQGSVLGEHVLVLLLVAGGKSRDLRVSFLHLPLETGSSLISIFHTLISLRKLIFHVIKARDFLLDSSQSVTVVVALFAYLVV